MLSKRGIIPVALISIWLSGTTTAIAAPRDLRLQADIDGDGKVEEVVARPQGDRCHISIDSKAQVVPLPAEANIYKIEGAVLDRGSNTRVLRLLGEFNGGYGLELPMLLDKGALVPLGTFNGVKYTGNGIVYDRRWRGFWGQRLRYRFDANTRRLTETPQDLYAVDLEVTVAKPFTMRLQRDRPASSITLLLGSKIRIVAASFAGCQGKKDDDRCAWFLIRSSSGLLGWASQTMLSSVSGLPWAG